MESLEKKSGLKDWRECITLDFPPVGPITAGTVRIIKEYHGMVRKPYNPKEYGEQRRRRLATPLP